MRADISYKSIGRVMGQLLLVEGVLLAAPLILEIADGEQEWLGFVLAIAGAFIAGFSLLRLTKGIDVRIHRREAFLLVSLAWIIFSLFGMIPYMLSAARLSVVDAFFETVSGFTTTGATTIADVEALSRGVLLWRAMTQWIGGLGIILFMLALLPQLNERDGIPMYNSESTGITHDKLHPRIRQTASALWGVYIVLTITLFFLLWAGPMDLFDAVCQTLATVSTGGFSTRNAGIAFWDSDYVALVLTVFMFLGGVNFSLLYGLRYGRWRDLWRNDVLRVYVYTVLLFTLGISLSVWFRSDGRGVSELFVKPIFHVVSTITTTGFSFADFSAWGVFPLLLTFLLMLSGACAGSTTGALKIDRLVAMKQTLFNEVKKSLNPKRVYLVKVNGGVVGGPAITRILAFCTIYALLAILGALLLTLFGINLTDAFFASLSCIGNNGLGYGLTGAAGGYHLLPDAAKWVLSATMLLGRLELFSMLAIFLPLFWRR